MNTNSPSYHGHRFPAEIISHTVWLYHRLCLSFRDVEDLLAERGVAVSYETIRQWSRKFGSEYARRLKRREGRLGDTWYLPASSLQSISAPPQDECSESTVSKDEPKVLKKAAPAEGAVYLNQISGEKSELPHDALPSVPASPVFPMNVPLPMTAAVRQVSLAGAAPNPARGKLLRHAGLTAASSRERSAAARSLSSRSLGSLEEAKPSSLRARALML